MRKCEGRPMRAPLVVPDLVPGELPKIVFLRGRPRVCSETLERVGDVIKTLLAKQQARIARRAPACRKPLP